LIDEETNEPIFLEFTPRFGYDAIFALAHLVESDMAGLLADIAQGKIPAYKAACGPFSGALRLHTPPYPEEEEDRAEDIPIFNFDAEKVEKGVSPCEVMLDSTGEPVTSGPNGYVFVVSALADTPHEAMAKAEKFKVSIPLMRYRTDLCEVLQGIYNDLLDTEWVEGGRKKSVFRRRHNG